MTDTLSSELKAMAQIEAALKGLTDEERIRVMQWAMSRFRSTGKPGPGGIGGVGPARSDETFDAVVVPLDLNTYAGLAEFYDAANPTTESDRALVAAYWFQVKDGTGEVESRKVHTELKHLGRGVTNITRAFETLKAARPALVIQTRKEGSTKQAQKKFKVTIEGKKAIERMIAKSHA